jgi:hypothetical protein
MNKHTQQVDFSNPNADKISSGTTNKNTLLNNTTIKVMNKEQQELLGDAYKNYFHKTPSIATGLTQEEFINKIKTDDEFARKWGLRIEERELSLIERYDIHPRYLTEDKLDLLFEFATDENLDKLGVPDKLITITYNDKTIESYE